jgi:hypothetical protein
MDLVDQIVPGRFGYPKIDSVGSTFTMVGTARCEQDIAWQHQRACR